jgi:hypothetical protein
LRNGFLCDLGVLGGEIFGFLSPVTDNPRIAKSRPSRKLVPADVVTDGNELPGWP